MAYTHGLGLATYQWCNSKVVNCVLSYLDFCPATVQRQISPTKKSFHCPAALAHYQKNMGGVDKTDQMWGHFGGFAAQSHSKKWYKKALMAVLDCMLLNAWHIWNLLAEKIEGRKNAKDTLDVVRYWVWS